MLGHVRVTKGVEGVDDDAQQSGTSRSITEHNSSIFVYRKKKRNLLPCCCDVTRCGKNVRLR